MKKIGFLIFILSFFVNLPLLNAEEVAGGKVILELLPEEDVKELEVGEQITSIIEVGKYFDENYPGEKINEDITDEVQRFFPKLERNDLYQRTDLIRNSVRFYRFIKENYEKIKSAFLVPEEPPLVLDDKDYEKKYTAEYIDSPDLVVINDFTKVVSYSSNPKDFKAYEEKNSQQEFSDKESSLNRIKDMFAKLELKKFLFYGTVYQDPLTLGEGNGKWSEKDGAKARIITAYAAVNNLMEIKAAIHFDLPPEKVLEMWGENKPVINLYAENLEAWSVLWPIPQRIELGDKKYIGKSGNFAIPVLLKVKNPNEELNIKALIAAKICDAKACQNVELQPELLLKKGFGYASTVDNFINQSFLLLPAETHKKIKFKSLSVVENEESAQELRVKLETSENPANLDVLVENNEGIKFSEPKISLKNDVVEIFIPTENKETTLEGKNFELLIKLNEYEALKITPKAEKLSMFEVVENRLTLGLFLLAIAGGLLLNFMPCVFPVLALKLMSISRLKGRSQEKVRKSFLYTIGGIFLAFAVLAGLLILFKELGYALGWGMQFQNSGFLVVMLFVMSLFLAQIMGIVEISPPAWLARKKISKQKEENFQYWFAGVLIVLMATPCTAPYLATAVGFALSATNGDMVLILGAIALGLALPYIIVWILPRMVMILPKPGKWMLNLQRIMVVLLLLTMVWLISIIYVQTSAVNVLRLILYLLMFGIMLVLQKILKQKIALMKESQKIKQAVEKLLRRVLLVIFILLVVLGVWDVGHNFKETKFSNSIETQKIDDAEIAKLIKAGKTVIVNIDAKWCLTCKFNEYTVFKSPVIEEIMRENNIVMINIDWTRYNPQILDFMARYGRKGVPFYVVFSKKIPGGMVLPEVLTEKDFRNLLRAYRN